MLWDREMGRISGCGCWLLVTVPLGIFFLGFYIQSCRTSQRYEANRLAEESRLKSEEGAKRSEEQKAEQKRRDFENYVVNFVKRPIPTQLTGRPYIKGKIINVSYDRPETGPATYRVSTGLNPDIPTAQSADEVGTVVMSKCDRVFIGNYREVATDYVIKAYRTDCEVTLIDHSIPAVIYKKSFRGEPPPKQDYESAGSNVYGEPPNIGKFLLSLPRR